MKRNPSVVDGDAFAKLLGIEVLEVGAGRARMRMAVRPDHLNGLGTVHGGAIFTLADTAFAAACNSHGPVSVAVSASILFMKAVTSGTLTAEASEDALNRRLGAYNIRVTDDNGELVATFQGLAYRKQA